MENQLIDFEELIKKIKEYEPTFSAVFNPDTGAVIKIGPTEAFENETNKISISKELVSDIGDGRIKMQRCFVDPYTNTIEIIEKEKPNNEKLLYKIPVVRWGGSEISEIYLTYYAKDSKLTIEMSEIYRGTKIFFGQTQERPLLWEENREISFFVTNYNDPHVIHKLIRIPIKDLIKNKKEVFLNGIPKKFSVYTNKIFKKYLIEIIDENS